MSEELFKERGTLQAAYAKSNAVVAKAQKDCRVASEVVRKFDAAHPEVMRAVHEQAGQIKKVAHAKEIAVAAELEAEEGVAE